MFYLGPAGNPLGSKDPFHGLEILKEEKLNAMEVQYTFGIKTKIGTAEEIGKIAKRNGIRLSAHAPYYINLNAREKAKLKKSKDWILRSGEMANALGADLIVFHPGFYHSMEKGKVTRIIARNAEDCVKAIEKEGWKVTLGLELTGKGSAWGTIEELVEVCGQIDGTIPVVDFAHHHARNRGCLKSAEDFEQLLDRYERLGKKFLHAHVSCIDYTEKGERKHLPLKAKDPDYSLLFPILKKKKYDIVMISESPLLDLDSLRMKKMLGIK